VTNAFQGSRLRIVYRSHGGENMKARPPYYSKMLALASVVRSVRESGVDPQVIFWNDGPIPPDRMELMRATGDIVPVSAGSNRESYRSAIEFAARGGWPDTDLVWFAEDDYLYRPETFRRLAEAAAAIHDADYLSVFGGLALDVDAPRTAPPDLSRWGAADATVAVQVGDATWYRGVSTTSTFGARLGVLREDRHLLRLLPYSGGAWDHTTCITVQGRQPFPWSDVVGEVMPLGRPATQWPASIARGLIRSGVNLRSHRAEGRRRRLYLCEPMGAVHLEVPQPDPELPPPPSDAPWALLAEETRRWGASQGITVPEHASA